MTPDLIENARDSRSTDSLLSGIIHTGTWQGEPDERADFWVSPRNYQFYSGIGSILRPNSVLELGVRMGYSLISLFRGSPAIESMIGIDLEHAFKDSQRMAEENLRQVGYQGRLMLPKADRQWLAQNAVGNVDLVHIDAGHTSVDIRKDILACWPLLRPGGTLIADDTDFIPELRDGIGQAASSLQDLEHSFYFPTFRGWWVAKKAGSLG